MKPKLPLISYVVATQYMHNSEGLRYLHKEVFNDEDPRVAKSKAKRYYDAAIEMLTDEKQISLVKKDSYSKEVIVYKNPELYDDGVSIFIRLNEDFKYNNTTFKSGKEFLLEIFAERSSQHIVKNSYARKLEQKTWNLMGQKTEKQLAELDFLYKSKLGIYRKERMNQLAERIASNQKTSMEIVRKTNEIGNIFESICAFLNTDGGEIVAGIDESLSSTGFLPNEDFDTFQEIFESTVFTMFRGFEKLIEFDLKQINGVRFYYFKVTRSANPAFLIQKESMEFYYRNVGGNVLDFDRTE